MGARDSRWPNRAQAACSRNALLLPGIFEDHGHRGGKAGEDLGRNGLPTLEPSKDPPATALQDALFDRVGAKV